jgi:hypothetical protein
MIINVSTGQAAVDLKGKLFAVIGIGSRDVKVTVNFGDQSFAYDA